MAVVPLEHPTTSEDIHSDVAASSCLCWDAAVVNKVVCNTDQGSNITAAPVLYQCSDCQDHISNTVLRRASHPAHFRGLTLCPSLWIQFTFLWKCFMFRHISVDIFRGLSRMSFANWTRTKLFHKANSEIMWQKLLVHDQMIHLVFSNASHGLPQWIELFSWLRWQMVSAVRCECPLTLGGWPLTSSQWKLGVVFGLVFTDSWCCVCLFILYQSCGVWCHSVLGGGNLSSSYLKVLNGSW